MKKWTHKACFDSYKAKPGNPRWSWSGRSEDGKTIAVTVWQDRFEEGIDVYRSRPPSGDKGWKSRPGHNELIGNLAWARDHCGGEVRIIIAIPVNALADPRAIKECFPRPDLRMRIAELDETSGNFTLKRIAS